MNYLSINLIFIFLLFTCNSDKSKDFDDKSLIIGTFNIQWLGDGIEDKVIRNEKDLMNLAFLISKSEIEFLALQEIENEKALNLLIDYLPGWSYTFIDNNSEQNQAFIYKDYIKIINYNLFGDLEVEKNRTRKGSLINIKYSDEEITILNVHLKSTSRYDDTPEKKLQSFELRKRQSNSISNIADSLTNLKKNFIVLGDFNDNPNRKGKSQIKELENILYFPTKDLRSCKAFYFDCIDHIALNKHLTDNLEPFSQLIIDTNVMFNEEELKGISDHCPVLIKLNF